MAKAKQPLKIGFVLDGGLEKPDGVQQYILTLGNYFKSQGHEIRHLVAGQIAPGIKDAVSLSGNLPVISNGNRLKIPLPASRAKLRAYMQAEQFDILHVQTPYSPMMGEKLIFLSGKQAAVIGTFHIVPKGALLNVGDWLLGKMCYFSLRRFDVMLATSTAAQRICKRDFGLDSLIVPNVINYQLFHSAKPLLKYRDGKVTILFFGRLVPRKGCGLLLLALAELVKTRSNLPDFRLLVCGSGPQAAAYKRFVAHHQLESYVEFTGFVAEKDKPRYYASADLAVFPSTGGESFGIVLLEAMSSGKAAVLAGNNEGYSAVMKDQPELLFDPKDKSAFADKLDQFMRDKALRQKYSQWAGVYAANFDVKLIGDKILKIYAEALLKKKQQ